MTRSRTRRLAAALFAGAALALTAVPALAVTPTVETHTNHREVPFVDCPDFATMGVWDFEGKLTFYYDSDGVRIRDREQVEFTGRILKKNLAELAELSVSKVESIDAPTALSNWFVR